MKKIATVLVVLAALALLVAFGGAHWLASQRILATNTVVDAADAELVARGRYLSQAADCAACHTAPGGAPLAGGLAMATPIGAIYSTNITPDKDSGIGNYSYADFKNAVQHGVRKDGTPLYPAMPYTSYVIMEDSEIQALYAYYMAGVTPVYGQNAASTIPWPLNMRWPLAWWQLLFARERSFQPPAGASAELVRGAYLVEGAGHCGACHTPRGVGYQELALADGPDHRYLSGELIDGWRAKSLRGEAQGLQSWSVEDVALFLRTGRTDRAIAYGAMADAVEHGTRFLTAADARAIAVYLKQLAPAPDKILSFPAKTDTTTQALLAGDYQVRGATLYMEHCVVCHQADGRGIPRVFPALEGNSAVFSKWPQSVIQVTLEGGRAPTNDVDSMAFAMPGFGHLGDQEIVDIVNFVRNGWTNQSPLATTAEVAHIRRFLAGKSPNVIHAEEP